MMEIDNRVFDQIDVIHEKVSSTIEKSNNMLHKKAVVLVNSIKETMGDSHLLGLEGIKTYTKNTIDLLDIIFKKNNPTEEDFKNAEALFFTLAICVKQLPNVTLRSPMLVDRLIQILKIVLLPGSSLCTSFAMKKYSIILLEKILLSRNERELKDDSDIVVTFYTQKILLIVEDCTKNHTDSPMLQKCVIKSLCKILRDNNLLNNLRMSLLKGLKDLLSIKIMSMCKDNPNEKKVLVGYTADVKALATSEGENVLKFLAAVIQFFPFDTANDLINELIDLIDVCENIHILLVTLMCFEVAFSTKKFTLETCEKILKILFNKEIILQLGNTSANSATDPNQKDLGSYRLDIASSLVVSYIKAISQILLSLSTINVFISLKYLIGVVSLFGEFLSAGDEFIKGSAFNCLNNLLSKLLSISIIESMFIPKSEEDDIIFEINITNYPNQTEFNGDFLLQKLSNILLYFVSSRFEDVKPGYNLLYTFLEQINSVRNQNVQSEHIDPINDNILFRLSEEMKMPYNLTMKIFLGKLFNVIRSPVILRYFPIGVIDFEICSDDFTETSNVWLISYIDKFIKNDSHVQTLNEFFECFFRLITELERVIINLKTGKLIIKDDNEMNVDMMANADMNEEDERFNVNPYETKHIRATKIKRYELILSQIWNILPKFLNCTKNNETYLKELFIKLETCFISYSNESREEEKAKDSTSSTHTILGTNMKEVVFKSLAKVIDVALKNNDHMSLECVKKDGRVFFSKCLNMIINRKLNKSELQEGFTMVTKFCKILNEKFLYKIICDMIDKFDKTIQSNLQFMDEKISNVAKFEEKVDISSTNDNLNQNSDTIKDKPVSAKPKTKSQKDKDVSIMCLRVEIITYILRNIKILVPPYSTPSSGNISFSSPINSLSSVNSNNQSTGSQTSGLFSLLSTFFEKFFYNKKVHSFDCLNKRLFDLFMVLLKAIDDCEYSLEVFNKFVGNKGLEMISSKQKAKLFEYILAILIKKLLEVDKLDLTYVQSQFHIILEIVSLTKDMNRKVRNLAYDMIGKVTDFMSDSNLFKEWIKMILAILPSTAPYIKSSAINAIARIFWQKRNADNKNFESFSHILMETAEVVLLLFKENNKEITKSIFIFIRVLLYILKKEKEYSTKIPKIIPKIIYSAFIESNEITNKEFKVKLRNLLKTLILNFSYEEIKKIIPRDQENLLAYVNKHIAKKIRHITQEEEDIHGYNKNTLDDSVMKDNEENLIDEEEEYIDKEFKKTEKKKTDVEKKFFEKLEKWNIEEEDPELVKKKNEADGEKKNEKLDKIEGLFKKDNIELENFFYVNPYARKQVAAHSEADRGGSTRQKSEELKDVIYDKKKGKLIVKDLEKEIEDSKLARKEKKRLEENSDTMQPLEKLIKDKPRAVGMKLLNKKRVQNVRNDDINADDSEEEDNMNIRKRVTRAKISQTESQNRVTKRDREAHYVKFSGEEYKNKAGKGDKLLQGKFEPFAYIQLNPKSISSKRRDQTLKAFEKLMKPGK